MFGYVKAHTPELKVAEYEYYRSVYCGLCRSMGKCTGQCSRLTLSYDFAFLALVRIALSDEKVGFKRRRCVAHPVRKRSMMEPNSVLEYCAYAAALLSYHKLSDDIADEKGLKRIKARILRIPTRRMRKKALKKGGLSELDQGISKRLSELASYEKLAKASVDRPADIFGELLADIMEYGCEGSDARIAKNIGYHIGRWIYIVDALDDLDEDARKGRYNPFLLMYGGEPSERERELAAEALKNELCDAEAAFDLLDYDGKERLCGVVRNVIYLGMPKTVTKIIHKDNCRKKGHSEADERSL